MTFALISLWFYHFITPSVTAPKPSHLAPIGEGRVSITKTLKADRTRPFSERIHDDFVPDTSNRSLVPTSPWVADVAPFVPNRNDLPALLITNGGIAGTTASPVAPLRSDSRSVANPRPAVVPAVISKPTPTPVTFSRVAEIPPTPTAGPDLMIFLRDGADGLGVARSLGLSATGSLVPGSNIWVMRSASPDAATYAASMASSVAGVQAAYVRPTVGLTSTARAFTPNDPLYFPGANPPVGGPGNTSDVLYPGQWHLINNMPASAMNVPTISAGLAGAWLNDFTGQGITIGVVDDGVEVTHPDLAPNNTAVAGLNRAFNDDGTLNGTNPAPVLAGDNHGTSVAGVAAARGNNSLGITGAAPFANLVGIRGTTSAAAASAYAHANGIVPGTIQVKNHSYGDDTPFGTGFLPLLTSIENSALAGTVNVIAIGNDRVGANARNRDGNKASPQSSKHAVMVGALASNGVFTSYSSYGANMIVTAPSGDSPNFLTGTITTDRTGAAGYNTAGTNNYAPAASGGAGLSYTNDFNGTSAAAPLVSGVVAVTLQANPALMVGNAGTGQTTTRAIKHLLVRTSTIVDATDATPTSDPVGGVGWRTNAGGRTFNQNYGFGLVNAAAMTTQAPLFSGVTPLTTFNTGSVAVGTGVPDNLAAGVSRTTAIAVPAGNVQPLEEVTVTLDLTHANRGQLIGYVTSPSGYRSRLFDTAAEDTGANIANWQFTTNAFWGEQPNGNWTVTVADLTAGTTGTWNNYTIMLNMGTLTPVPEPASVLGFGAVALIVIRFRRRAYGTPLVS